MIRRHKKNIPVLQEAGCHFRLIVVGLGSPIGRARARAQQFADRLVRGLATVVVVVVEVVRVRRVSVREVRRGALAMVDCGPLGPYRSFPGIGGGSGSCRGRRGLVTRRISDRGWR
jgi:hypothetical protein